MAASPSAKRVLIVDRDVAGVEVLRLRLGEAGFAVSTYSDGAAAAVVVAQRLPHLLIIDWNVPGFMAADLIQRMRAAQPSNPIRIIILSALAEEQDVVNWLNFGADDYVAKPFSPGEVVARVNAVLRAPRRDPQPEAHDSLALDAATHRLAAHGHRLHLKGIEYRLLKFLMANAGRTFNRTQLRLELWGDDADINERTIDANVQRLRKILSESGCEAYIQTVRGFGYRLSADALPQLNPLTTRAPTAGVTPEES